MSVRFDRSANRPPVPPIVRALAVIVLAGAFILCRYADVGAVWQEIRRSDDIVVYARDDAEAGWVSTRAEALIAAPMAAVVPMFTDIAKSQQITPHCEEKRILKPFSDLDRIEYSRIRIVWPFRERYLIYHAKVVFMGAEDVRMEIENAGDFPYEDRERIRASIRNGRFFFSAVNQGQGTRVILESELKASGWLPDWLMDYAAHHWMFDMVRNLRKELQRARTTSLPAAASQ